MSSPPVAGRASSGVVIAGVAVALAAFSLPWLSIGALGAARLGGLALLGCLSLLCVPAELRRVVHGDERPQLVQAGTISILLVLAGTALLLSDAVQSAPSFGDGRASRLAVFAFVVIASTGAGTLLRRTPMPHAVILVPAAVMTTVFSALVVLVRRSGQDAGGALRAAIGEGSVTPILDVVWRSHHVVDDTLAASIRHVEIRGIIVAVLVALAYGPTESPRFRRFVGLLGVFAAGVAVVLFSRVNVLTIAVTLSALGVWTWGRCSIRARVAGAAVVGGFMLGLARIDVVVDALLDRSTLSSEERWGSASSALERLPDTWRLGSLQPTSAGVVVPSPHNTVLDLWLGAGVVGGVIGALIVGLMIRLLWDAGRCLAATHDLGQALAATGTFGLFTVVLLRALTGGGGLLDPVSWMALGMALASPSASVRPTPIEGAVKAGR